MSELHVTTSSPNKPARRRRVYSASLRFEVLGPMRVLERTSDRPVGDRDESRALGGPKQRIVLALLLAEPNRVVSIDSLIDGVWGDEPPDSARHTVQSYVSELRKVVGDVIERAGSGYRVHVDERSLDTIDFEARVTEARQREWLDPADVADDLEEALALWRGAPYGDLGGDTTLRAESARLDELRVVAIEALMKARLAAGQRPEVVVELERLTRAYPYREELRALHMIALYRSGRQADALRSYRVARDVLNDDLGLIPTLRLRRLEEQILVHDPKLDADHNGSDSEPQGELLPSSSLDVSAPVGAEAEATETSAKEGHEMWSRRRTRRWLAPLLVAAAVLAALIAFPIATDRDGPGRVVVVLGAGRDVSIFDELIADAVEKATDDVGLEAEVMEPPYTDAFAELQSTVVGASVVVASPIFQRVVLRLAPENPDTVFVMLDSTDAPEPNTVGVSFRSEEGAFLAGAAAALRSETGRVGFIGGNESPTIEAFRAGFEDGVAAVAADVLIVTDVVVSGIPESEPYGYSQPEMARYLAYKMYESGVDVIFVAAGESGAGVVEAATEGSTATRQLWAIGADSDWSFDLDPEQRQHVMGSMFKRFDIALSDVVAAYSADALSEAGTMSFGLAEGAVGYVDTSGEADAGTLKQIDELRVGIADASITVDAVPT